MITQQILYDQKQIVSISAAGGQPRQMSPCPVCELPRNTWFIHCLNAERDRSLGMIQQAYEVVDSCEPQCYAYLLRRKPHCIQWGFTPQSRIAVWILEHTGDAVVHL